MSQLIIFDFDGVIADSEMLAATTLADAITALGLPTSPDDTLRLYLGKRMAEVTVMIEHDLGRTLPANFVEDLEVQTLACLDQDLRAVAGVRDFVDNFAHVPRCVASSSPPSYLKACLEILQLSQAFGAHVFSATQVARGKPHPDIFLHAAETMGIEADKAIVIEDSPTGVQAGVAAGMTVIGLLAGSHIRDGHEARLRSAGAHFVARSFAQAESITRDLLAV